MPKRIRAWSQIADAEALWWAWRRYAAGKRRRPAVAAFALDADRAVVRLAAALRAGRWSPGRARRLFIADPKRRLISAAPVVDRVLHQAIHGALAPRWNRSFIDHSYACLAGRGSHRAVLRFMQGMRRYRYVIQLDVARYFYQIDHGILGALLARRLPERPLRAVLERIIAVGDRPYRERRVAEWLGWSAPGRPGCGLPIGNLTSQWWGNVYLDGLDHFACRTLRVAHYQRYMDDMAWFGDDRAAMLDARDAIAEWLATHRSLRLKAPDARPVRTTRRVGYLGFTVTQAGLSAGARARAVLAERVRGAGGSPAALEASLAAVRGHWMFGSPG